MTTTTQQTETSLTTVANMGNQSTTRRILVRHISLNNGSWQYVRGRRGYVRIVIVDSALGNDSGLLRANGTVRVLAESRKYDTGSGRQCGIISEWIAEKIKSIKKRYKGMAIDMQVA